MILTGISMMVLVSILSRGNRVLTVATGTIWKGIRHMQFGPDVDVFNFTVAWNFLSYMYISRDLLLYVCSIRNASLGCPKWTPVPFSWSLQELVYWVLRRRH